MASSEAHITANFRAKDNTSGVWNKLQDQMRKTQKQAGQLNGTFRIMRGGLGQVGHQVQDIAVQLQMGTDAMIVFGQQGSQIASLMGPKGAVIGAVLALGAALSVALRPSVDEAKDSLNQFMKKTRETATELDFLTQSQRDFDAFAKQTQIGELTKRQGEHKENISSTRQTLAGLRQEYDKHIQSMSGASEEYIAQDQNLSALNDQIAFYEKQLISEKNSLDDVTQAIAEKTGGVVTAAQEDAKRQKRIDQIIQAAKQEADTVGMTAGAIAAYRASLLGASPAQLEAIANSYALVSARQAEFDATQSQAKALESLLKQAEDQAATLGMTARGLALYRASQNGATAADIDAINASYDLIDAHKARAKADKEAAQQAVRNKREEARELEKLISLEQKRRDEKLEEAFKKEADVFDKLEALEDGFKSEIELIQDSEAEKLAIVRDAQKIGLIEHQQATELRNKITQESARAEVEAYKAAEKEKQDARLKSLEMDAMLVANMSNITGMLMQNMDQQSSAYKALFAFQKAMAIATTIIQYELAIARTVGETGIFGLPLAKILRAQQVASVAIIAGQTLASFEGGGFTGPGVRSGGMDGKGGMLAMLHPNEKVIDMEKSRGGSQAVNVSFNIQANDAQGFDELLYKRRGMITSMVNQALNNRGKRLP